MTPAPLFPIRPAPRRSPASAAIARIALLLLLAWAAAAPAQPQTKPGRQISSPATPEIPWEGLAWIFGFTSFALAITVLWNLQLRRRVGETSRALAGEAERFRLTFENAAAGIAHVGIDGRFLRVNPRFAAMLGYRPEELEGLLWRQCTHPEDVEEGDRVVHKVLYDGVPSYSRDKRYVRKDGAVIWARVTVSAVRDTEGRPLYYITVAEDITQRKQAELTINQQRDFLNLVIENLPVGIFAKDVRDDYRFVIFNPLMEKLIGVASEQILGKTDYDLIPTKEEADYYRTVDRQVMNNRKIVDIPLEHVTGHQHIVPAHTVKVPVYDEKGQPHLLLGILEDLTERQAAERALRESETRYRSLYEHMSEVMVLQEIRYDPQGRPIDFTILDANPAWEKAFGLNRDKAVGKTATQVYGHRPPLFLDIYARVAETGQPENFETFLKEVGKEFAVSVFCPSRGRCGVVALDITPLKKAEEERRKLDAQVQHAQKLESLGVLAGGIAHDFNNLLVGILGNADLALSGMSHLSPARENIRDIELAARRAADLCRQMLAYSGKGRFVIEPLALSDVVREMAHILEVAVSKKARLRYEFAPNIPPIEADATQIRQVVMNLITNASEALGESTGVISIVTGAMECNAQYLCETYLDDDLPPGIYAFLEVSDSGCGMTPETRAKIFEPFFTTKFTGRGLGLAAVLGIVRGHRGAIKIYSEPQKGTTFRVLFPITDEAPKKHQSHLQTAIGAWRGTGTILLVDDEETVRAVGKRMLEQAGFHVLTAADGLEGVELLQNRSDEITCILLDLTMPRMDGEQAFREIRRILPHIPVILSSGYNEQEVVNRFAGKKLAGFIQKPYQTDALLQKIRTVLDKPPPPENQK